MNTNIKIELTSLLSVILITQGCGKWPEIVNSKKDILSLPETLTSVRARGLSDNDVPFLARFKNLSYLDFTGGSAIDEAAITDKGLYLLAQVNLPKLETLSLGYCQNITDVGLSCIASNRTIRWLSVMGCQKVTDRGLEALMPMRQLNALDLRGCRGISDTGLSYLGHMTNISNVLLGGCPNITSSGMEMLQKELPDCRIEKDENEWRGHRNDYKGKKEMGSGKRGASDF